MRLPLLSSSLHRSDRLQLHVGIISALSHALFTNPPHHLHLVDGHVGMLEIHRYQVSAECSMLPKLFSSLHFLFLLYYHNFILIIGRSFLDIRTEAWVTSHNITPEGRSRCVSSSRRCSAFSIILCFTSRSMDRTSLSLARTMTRSFSSEKRHDLSKYFI